jgi:ribosomal protein S12 methylthiotransferase accessory factor
MIDCLKTSFHPERDCSVIGAPQPMIAGEARMDAADLSGAAAMLESDAAHAPQAARDIGTPAALLNFLGLLGPNREIYLARHHRRQFARLLRMAARLDAVFPMRLPTAPKAAFFGARGIHGGGEGSVFEGAGRPKRTDYAGLGVTLAEAFCACIGEAAEHDSMFLRKQDGRLAGDGALPLLNAQLRASGGIEAALVLREAGAGRTPPRSSTGYAAGRTREDAALRALLECVERHAVSLWFNGLRRPVSLAATNALKAYAIGLRGAEAPQARLMLLPHDVKGAVVVAARSVSAVGGLAVGYGCALSAERAAMKAVRELCQGEFALHQESQSATPGLGAFTSRSMMFLARPGLFDTDAGHQEDTSGEPSLASLCAGFPQKVRFVDLTLPGDGVPVVCALADGLKDIASEFAPGQTGPL